VTTRLVQAGRGSSRALVIVYHYTAELDRAVRDACGASPCVVNVTEQPGKSRYARVGPGGLAPLDEVRAWAEKTAGAVLDGRLVLVGFSEGCQALRAHLRAGAFPAAVVAVDGTHANLPPDEATQIVPWRAYFEAARAVTGADGPHFVASHTDIRTDLIGAGAYMPTRKVLERVTGWLLPVPTTLRLERPTRENNAVVYSFGGRDAAAHVHQAREVLPALLAREVAPWAWPAAEAEAVPPPALPAPEANVERLPAERTPVEPAEVAGALGVAWLQLFGTLPTRESILVLLAQWALETARGKSMWCFNLGNAKSREGDGRCYCYFACNEVLPPAIANAIVQKAKPRTDGKPGPDAAITGASGKDVILWAYPDNPVSRFRAYRTLREGAVDYLALLSKRFWKAWPAVLSGDAVAFVTLLREQGYYTAPLATYLRAHGSWMRAFKDLAFALPAPVLPEDPADHDDGLLSEAERSRVLGLVALTSMESIREDIEAGFDRAPALPEDA
jgi:hypothetical protein